MATGFVFHELFLWHNTGNWTQLFQPGLTLQPLEHAENPETKRRLRNLLEVSGLLDHLVPLKPRPATVDEVCRFHDRAYVERIKAQSDVNGGDASLLTPFGRGSYEIALLAAGGAMVAMDAVLTGQVKNAYALIRPPGHHAIAEYGMGFCLFGNAALAIMHARAQHGVERIATVDWDVHHGNGTQSAFYDDPATLTISLHQDRLYPTDSGTLLENGRGAGQGYNLNIPLPPGSGDGAYEAAVRRVIMPALLRFKPDLIVVPCGFDASGADPLGRMLVSSEGFRAMTRMVMEVADQVCGGRIVMTHEGGYSAAHAPYCGLAVIEELAGLRTGVDDPWAPHMAKWGQQSLQPHQDAAIAEAELLLAGIK